MSFIDFPDSLYDDAVSGVGLMKWCNKKFKPTSADLSYDNSIEVGDVWFVKRDFLPEMFAALPPNCPTIRVVTQHSDYELDRAVMSRKPSCVTKVFSPNNVYYSEDSIAIPLGLGPPPPIGHGAPLAEDIKAAPTRNSRSKLLYVNFRTHTYSPERLPLWNHFYESGYSWATLGSVNNNDSFEEYLDCLVSHKFSLCPRGNGIDTHRLWESLYSRTVPVVRYCEAHRNFKDLPILFVDDWSQVTEDFLESKYEEMTQLKWDYRKMSASWWGKQFKE